MFNWKRRIVVTNGKVGPLIQTPTPISLEFKLLSEILIDAESYDNKDQLDVRNRLLDILIDKIKDVQLNSATK